jgi:hypothetical protein
MAYVMMRNNPITYNNIFHVGVCESINIIRSIEKTTKLIRFTSFNDLIRKRTARHAQIIENQFAYNPPYMPTRM